MFFLAFLAALAPACGGGGGGGSATVLEIQLGTLASTIVTRTPIAFTNALASEATITAGPTTGPFEIDPADLPATAPAGGSVSLGLLCSPAGPGLASGSITLFFDGASGHAETTWVVTATGEQVTWTHTPQALDFGEVPSGNTRDLLLRLTNLSTKSPVTFTSATMPAAYSIVSAPFPLVAAAGADLLISVRYAPPGEGVHDGVLRLGPSDAGGPVDVPLLGSSDDPGREEVHDFGSVALDAFGRTPELEVEVPADAISFSVEGLMGPSNGIGLHTLTGPGGKVYENASSTGDYVWSQGWHAFLTHVPNTDRPNVQLVPGGGTYRFRLKRMGGSGSTMTVRAFVERRPGGASVSGTLPLNVWLANGIAPTAATAPSDAQLQAVLSRVDAILSNQGIRLGDIAYYDVTDPRYDEVTESEFAQMLQLTSAAAEERLNLFFVKEAIGGGVVGAAAAVSGAKRNGTSVSGVMSIYSGFGTDTIGLIAAHELGHFLGLYHTVEQNGSHDFIDDTANCPANGPGGPCPVEGGGLLMHWLALGGSKITDGQGLVIRGHPLMEPGAASVSKPAALPQALLDPFEDLGLPAGWCATCRHDEKGGAPLDHDAAHDPHDADHHDGHAAGHHDHGE